MIFVLETIAAPHLHADRFLAADAGARSHQPQTRGRQRNVSRDAVGTKASERFAIQADRKCRNRPENTSGHVQKAEALAQTQATVLRESALMQMNRQLGHEVQRLQMLRQVNDHVRPQEIELAQAQQRELARAIEKSRLRLDCLRLIWKGPLEALS